MKKLMFTVIVFCFMVSVGYADYTTKAYPNNESRQRDIYQEQQENNRREWQQERQRDQIEQADRWQEQQNRQQREWWD